MTKRSKWPFSFAASLLYVITAGHPVLAEDTEVLIGSTGQSWATPNVLFIMDTSGSMSSVDNPSEDGRTRLRIVQDVFRELMNSNAGFNVGLMRFDPRGSGGYFVSPMQLLDANNRDAIIAASEGLTASGNTPLAESLYEAALYFRGDSAEFGGSDSVAEVFDADLSTDKNRVYSSPITSQCQRNYVVLLTDGQPVGDDQADNLIPNLPGYNSGSCGYSADDCLDEVADYMNTVDLSADITGEQNVNTYTIGFTSGQALLRETAQRGGGSYVVANDDAQLRIAFEEILQNIVDANDTFSPPALAANTFSNISHFNTLYFTLFEPASSPKWKGNVKPYRLGFDPLGVYDATNRLAIDNRGFFRADSVSLWSTRPDGGSIEAGGANAQLPSPGNRKVFTYTDAYTYTNGVLNGDTVALDNTVPYELLGLDATAVGVDTRRDDIIATTLAATLGAPLHSQPVVVTYGGTETDPVLTLFVTTNSGFLHALNARTGEEQSAFIPKELLINLDTLTQGVGPHPYGLDGDITVWVNDLNGDGDGADVGEHVYLYTGMRRGGSNYYALDVTNPEAPKLLWVIEGNGVNPDFAQLGQTWSKPTLASVRYGGASKKVLIFAGGYDTDQDNTTTNAIGVDDDMGRAIYIVDAETGTKLWEAGPTPTTPTAPDAPIVTPPDLLMDSMTNSIPSDIRVLDMDYDGFADLLYVGDMRGQLFRFDIDNSGSDFTVSGTLMAKLAGADAANNRRFYYPPDVVLTQRPGEDLYLSVNIGSGYRAHPLNPVNADGTPGTLVRDAFYSVRDPYVNGVKPPQDFVAITEDQLYDATTQLVEDSVAQQALDASKGWRIDLAGNGEKVLAPAMTVNGQLLFTTYTPPPIVKRGDCAPPPGNGTLYRVNLFNGNPILPAQTAEDNTAPTMAASDRAEQLERPGIPSAPVVVFKKDGDNNVDIVECVGTACNQSQQRPVMTETYWRNES